MSRIDYRPVFQEPFVQPAQPGKSNAADKVTAAAAAQLRRTTERGHVATPRAIKRAAALLSTHSVAPGDLDGMQGKSSEDMLADLTRILSAIEAYDSEYGADDISMLARTMLEENIRRVETFLIAREADGRGDRHGA